MQFNRQGYRHGRSPLQAHVPVGIQLAAIYNLPLTPSPQTPPALLDYFKGQIIPWAHHCNTSQLTSISVILIENIIHCRLHEILSCL
jgi:hypothetical protein